MIISININCDYPKGPKSLIRELLAMDELTGANETITQDEDAPLKCAFLVHRPI